MPVLLLQRKLMEKKNGTWQIVKTLHMSHVLLYCGPNDEWTLCWYRAFNKHYVCYKLFVLWIKQVYIVGKKFQFLLTHFSYSWGTSNENINIVHLSDEHFGTNLIYCSLRLLCSTENKKCFFIWRIFYINKKKR